jgi:hypothetical protein
MKKCDHYNKADEIIGWVNEDTPVLNEISRCYRNNKRNECSCGGDRSKCDFYPEIREKAHIRIYNEGLFFIDKYGNTTTIDDAMLQYKQNSPTYDELYEHWLKTKTE